MELFIDTADIDEIRKFSASGLVDGVTTNPSLVYKSGRKIETVLREICEEVAGPVSAEVTATETDEIVEQGEKLALIAANIVIKVPLTWDGLRGCRRLTESGHKVNVTLCCSAAQALFAAKSGATYISPFIGRLDDICVDGMEMVEQIREIYDSQNLATKILAASIRSPAHVIEAAAMGVDAATLPPKIYDLIMAHPVTAQGLAAFLADWEKTGQNI